MLSFRSCLFLVLLVVFQILGSGCRNIESVSDLGDSQNSDRFTWLYQVSTEKEPLAGDASAENEAALVQGRHVAYRSDTIDLKVDLTLLPDGSFPPAFSVLMGRELHVERYADRVVSYLDGEERANVRSAVIESLSRDGAEIKDLPFAKLLIKNEESVALNVRVMLEIEGYSREAARTLSLQPGQEQQFVMSPSFKSSIMEISEETMSMVALRVERIEGGMLFEETVPVRVLSKNDMVWSRLEYLDIAGLVATFVTPRDSARSIDALLRQAADRSPIGKMVGYQELAPYTEGRSLKHFSDLSHSEIVEMQLKAIYEAIQARGMAYINAPVSFKTGAQRVKFADEVLEDRSGNCVELTVLFASALEALGMRPEVILLPGHCMLGVRAWSRVPGEAENAELIVLESTLVGRASYAEARKRGEETFALAAQDSLVLLLPIDALRELGIPPASR